MTLVTRLKRSFDNQNRTIIGLMSGMSMDGVDLALAKCGGVYPNYKVELIASSYRPYGSKLKDRLIRGRSADVAEVARLNVLVATEFAACVNDFLVEMQLSPGDIDAIGSHGQTLYHSTSSSSKPHTSLQVGSPSLIAELTGIATIGNFRMRDIAVDGQGAPLVAFADHVIHHNEVRPFALLNLGSIANITVLSEDFHRIEAFDLGPANMPIDFFATLCTESGIDESGKISAQGQVIEPLLDSFLCLSFFSQVPPKAAGYDEFGPDQLTSMSYLYRSHAPKDLLRTAVEFSARAISLGIQKHVRPNHPDLRTIKVSGGGIYNTTLVNRIRALLPEFTIVVMEDRYADAKEALAFAVLAHATLSGMPGNIPNATGATKSVILGEIAV